MSLLVASLAGGLIAVGILGIVIGLRPAPVVSRSKPTRSRISITPRNRMLLLAGLGFGVLGWVVTGWVLALVIAPVAAIGLPILLAAPPAATQINRLEAMEEWTRSLSGVLTVGIGLEQALVTTLRSTPAPLRAEVETTRHPPACPVGHRGCPPRVCRRTRRRHRRSHRREPHPRRPPTRRRTRQRARRARRVGRRRRARSPPGRGRPRQATRRQHVGSR